MYIFFFILNIIQRFKKMKIIFKQKENNIKSSYKNKIECVFSKSFRQKVNIPKYILRPRK